MDIQHPDETFLLKRATWIHNKKETEWRHPIFVSATIRIVVQGVISSGTGVDCANMILYQALPISGFVIDGEFVVGGLNARNCISPLPERICPHALCF